MASAVCVLPSCPAVRPCPLLTLFVSFSKELGEQLCEGEWVVPEISPFLSLAIVVARDGRMLTAADWQYEKVMLFLDFSNGRGFGTSS